MGRHSEQVAVVTLAITTATSVFIMLGGERVSALVTLGSVVQLVTLLSLSRSRQSDWLPTKVVSVGPSSVVLASHSSRLVRMTSRFDSITQRNDGTDTPDRANNGHLCRMRNGLSAGERPYQNDARPIPSNMQAEGGEIMAKIEVSLDGASDVDTERVFISLLVSVRNMVPDGVGVTVEIMDEVTPTEA